MANKLECILYYNQVTNPLPTTLRRIAASPIKKPRIKKD